MGQEFIAAATFIVTYGLIATEKVHKSVGAMAGALIMILLGVLSQEQALESVDFNVLFLLVGMMIIANTLGKTGVFQWVAVKSARLGKGEPFTILLIISVITALLSSVLANVTVVVLVAPVVFFIASRLQISPVPFLLAEIIASNIGGTATLIGDPPNTLIGSAAGLDFMAFILNLMPIVAITLVAFLATCRILFGKQLKADGDLKAALMEIEARDLITDKSLMTKSITILVLTIFGFFFQGMLGVEAGAVAMAGALALILITRQDSHKVFAEIDWPTLSFFVGLFVIAGGLVSTGLIGNLAAKALDLIKGDVGLTSMLILWLSAILSGIVDNIPYTTTMIPFIQALGGGMDTTPLWWSLALGACLGGNATIIGAAPNVVVAQLATKAGYPISFFSYLKYGVIITFESIVLSSLYVWLRYLL